MKFKAVWSSATQTWRLICPLGGCSYNYRLTKQPHDSARRHAQVFHEGLLKG